MNDCPLLQALCAAPEQPWMGNPVALVSAHPDDEVIGAGSRLELFSEALTLIHVTNGSPRNLYDAKNCGFSTHEEYACARHQEMCRALSLAGISLEQIHQLEFVDQETSQHLADIARRLARILGALRPHAVITHPYEGGHPDHDSTAFAVHAACRLLASQGISPPELLEMTSYHNREGNITPFEFLPHEECKPLTVFLSPGQKQKKKNMLDCYATQRETLGYFPVEVERFRKAPSYDFCSPPHDGVLFYEMFDWGMTGERWRQLAREALDQLGVNTPL